MDTGIVQHPKLHCATAMELNHILLHPIDFHKAINAMVEAFMHLYEMFDLYRFNLKLSSDVAFLKSIYISRLCIVAKTNKFGFKSSKPSLFLVFVVKNEFKLLLSHLFICGLDKANQNACFMCIYHIRLQAYKRLKGEDFSPCQSNGL